MNKLNLRMTLMKGLAVPTDPFVRTTKNRKGGGSNIKRLMQEIDNRWSPIEMARVVDASKRRGLRLQDSSE